ncbi:MAG: Holliday junction branch migration protein RuvA [Candidatus Brocadiia bacterium]
MYHHLRGKLYSKTPGEAVVEAAGVGFRVRISNTSYDSLPLVGQECFLYVETVRRDDGDSMYGFISPAERRMYMLLTTVNRIGPAVALGILSTVPVSRLADAIKRKDTAFISTLKGVGKTTAERIIVELAAKVDSLLDAGTAPPIPMADDAVRALEALGIDRGMAQKAVADTMADLQDGNDMPALQDVIVSSLRRLRRG